MADRLGVGKADDQLIHQPLGGLGAGHQDELHIGGEELADQVVGIESLHRRAPLATGAGGQVQQVGIVHHRGHRAGEIRIDLRLHVGLEQSRGQRRFRGLSGHGTGAHRQP
jgi:hypothetical protein